MENLKVQCRSCGKEIQAYSNKTVTCGCSNMTTICGEKISAIDLANVIMVTDPKSLFSSKTNVLSNEDIQWQEERKKRKIRKIDFEER
jgi:hypothetical protein